MIAWINIISMVGSALLSVYFYVKSAGPAALEKKIGERAYHTCTQYRAVSGIFMGVHFAAYVVYYFYPLPVPIPPTFPWDWWYSGLGAVVIAVPSGYLMWRGIKDAGEETMVTKKEHVMYKGIYQKIRHPQAVGEMPFAWVFSFLLHSPFLVLFSFVWIPLFYLMCLAEEKDLIIRYGEEYLEYKRTTGFIIPKRSR